MRPQYSALVVLVALLFGRSCDASVPHDVFEFENIKIGTATLADVQKKYGEAKIIRANREEESPISLCYFFGAADSRTYVSFESGPLGGWDKITGLRISRQSLGDCTRAAGNISISAGHGVYLGQREKEFVAKFDVEFKRSGNDLLYMSETKRAATSEEIRRTQSVFPSEKDIQFDVVVTIKAKFESNQLVDYSVSKLESF